MNITKCWAMPNRRTFKIRPIYQLILKYQKPNMIIIDAFANDCKIGTITNDLNPEFDTTYNMDALSFLKRIETLSCDFVLFDPPYSISQAAECYKSYGKDKLSVSVANMAYWSSCKNEISRILKEGGILFMLRME